MEATRWFMSDAVLPIGELVRLGASYRVDSLVAAIEGVIAAKERAGRALTEEQLVVLSVEAMEREVNNGGFDQFFRNASVRFAPRLISDLERIGAMKTRDVVKRAVHAVGIEWAQVTEDAVYGRLDDDEVADVLSSLDSDYYMLDEDVAGLLFTFFKVNVENFD
jgi:hypothetical protein